MDYRKYTESFPNFPKKDVLFWDFTPLIHDPAAFRHAIADITGHFEKKSISKIAAIEAKGFVIGSAAAYALAKPLVLIRKPGLIPGEVIKEGFIKEYGTGEYELSKADIEKGDKVLITYDILAAPGATEAAIRLVEKAGGKAIGCAYVIELEYLNARAALQKMMHDPDIFSLVKIKEKNP